MALLEKNKNDEMLESLGKINFNFEGANTQYSTHKFHPYPARFIPQIPKTFIELFTKEGDTVLDPMCGCGTTIVEAFLNKRIGIGNDINPLACLISKVKTTLIKEKELDFFEKEFKVSKKQAENFIKNLPKRKIRDYFSYKKTVDILELKELINTLENKDLYDLARVAFSSVIWSFIECEGKLDIKGAFVKRINMMKKELFILNSNYSAFRTPHSAFVLNGDSRKLNLDDGIVDLIVTSPPYVNALDYYREHMFNMHFLNMDIGLFKKNEIGGHSHFIPNRFRLLSEYLGDMTRSMIEMNRVLKDGKLCVIVIGNSNVEYELIESHKFFSSIAKDIGFKHYKTFKRNIDTTKKYTSKNIGKINQEYLVVLEKIGNSVHHSNDDGFIGNIVKREMESFREKRKIKKQKLNEAIELIHEDIKLK